MFLEDNRMMTILLVFLVIVNFWSLMFFAATKRNNRRLDIEESRPLLNLVSEHETKRIMMIALCKSGKQVRATQQPVKAVRYVTK